MKKIFFFFCFLVIFLNFNSYSIASDTYWEENFDIDRPLINFNGSITDGVLYGPCLVPYRQDRWDNYWRYTTSLLNRGAPSVSSSPKCEGDTPLSNASGSSYIKTQDSILSFDLSAQIQAETNVEFIGDKWIAFHSSAYGQGGMNLYSKDINVVLKENNTINSLSLKTKSNSNFNVSYNQNDLETIHFKAYASISLFIEYEMPEGDYDRSEWISFNELYAKVYSNDMEHSVENGGVNNINVALLPLFNSEYLNNCEKAVISQIKITALVNANIETLATGGYSTCPWPGSEDLSRSGSASVGLNFNIDSITIGSAPKIFGLITGIHEPLHHKKERDKDGNEIWKVGGLRGKDDAALLYNEISKLPGWAKDRNNPSTIVEISDWEQVLNNMQIRADETLVFYVSAHGTNRFQDAEQENPTRSIYTDDEAMGTDGTYGGTPYFRLSDDALTLYFKNPKWDLIKKIFILDFCHSGGFVGDHSSIDKGDLEKLPNTIVFAAAREDKPTGSFTMNLPGPQAPLPTPNAINKLGLSIFLNDHFLPFLKKEGYNFNNIWNKLSSDRAYYPSAFFKETFTHEPASGELYFDPFCYISPDLNPETPLFGSFEGSNKPISNAGIDQIVITGTTVVMDGSFSLDPQGNQLIYFWTQVAGPPITLDLTNPEKPQFIAPEITEPNSLTFQLVVSNGVDNSEPDNVDILIKFPTFYFDSDGDGYGDDNNSIEAPEQPENYTLTPFDCNDLNPSIYPGAEEICGDGIDQDCDGQDLECTSVPGDLNGDGLITADDYYSFRSTLGKCTGDEGFIAEADYDEDECISYADYRIWYGYYRDSL